MSLKDAFSNKKSRIDEELGKLLKREPASLYEPLRYHVLGGGKRVRPVLCLLGCEAVGGDPEIVMPLALGLELVHAFTLIHDDIMDRDDLRRGQETVYKKWGEALAINAGDGLFALSHKAVLQLDIQESKKYHALRVVSDAILSICEGQAMDLDFETQEVVSLEEYMKMAALKTGSLISASVASGAIAAGGSEEYVTALAEYGHDVGLAFQVWDDYIDFASEKTGKTRGSDIKKGKKTSIVCYAMDNLGDAVKKRLKEILDVHIEETTGELVDEAVGILESAGAIKYAKDTAVELVESAKNCLEVLPESDAKKVLEEFADYVVEREV